MSENPINFKHIKGDAIGTGISGTGNLVGKKIHYTVNGNVININNPSDESLEQIKKILVVPNETSIEKDTNIKDANTLQDLRLLEKHIQEVLDLLTTTDNKIGITTKEIKAGKIQISRIDLLLKRSIVLAEQASQYWNVATRNSDINMYRIKLKEAYTLLLEAIKLDSYNTEILLHMAKIQGKLIPNNPNKMREILYRVQNLLDITHNDIEKYQLGQANFLLATSDNPIDYELLEDARTIFWELSRGDWVRQCDRLLQPARDNRNVSAKAWYNKALVLNTLDRYEQAIECFDKAIEIDAIDPKIWNGRGSVLGHLGKYEQAIECFDKAIEIDPNNVGILKNKGTALHYLAKYEQAIECFDKAIEIDSDDGTIWCGKGISLDYLGKYQQAIECFDKAIEINPNGQDIWYNKGVALDYLRKYEQALTCYNNAIDIDPDSAVAWYGKATALRKLGISEQALTCYNNAIDIDPDSAVAWYGKGLVMNSLDDKEKAQEYFDKARALGLKT
jgi:tetratricopeptide (TPR) repeat protein